ncbi:MAG: cyclic nucleotide-binding domain-containing protein [Candidatus Sericytochromatia bacterium]|nr:cyclic nucleotide-binding domain-containing protein [Candidatus Tanganyikabacteria bacterium]
MTAVELLERVPLFYDFSHSEVRKIAQYADYAVYGPRERIYRMGDPGDRIYVVVAGLVRLTHHDDESVHPEDLIVRSRGLFGEDCAVDESPRGLTAEAIMRSECITLTSHALRRLEEEHPRIALRLIKKLARVTSLRLRQVLGRPAPVPATLPAKAAVPAAVATPAGKLHAFKRLVEAIRNQAGEKAVKLA